MNEQDQDLSADADGIAARRARFIEHLAISCNVRQSAKVAGLSESGLYAHKRKSPDFCGQWRAALVEGYARLEADMLHRALYGVKEDIWHGGKIVGQRTQISDQLGLHLMKMHRASVMAMIDDQPPEPLDVLRARLAENLASMRQRLLGRDDESDA